MTIRRLTPTDAALAVPLLADLGYPTTREALADRIAALAANEDSAAFLAEEDGLVLGLVAVHSFEMLHRAGRLGRITALVVSPSAQGRGIGTRLLRAAEAHLAGCGCVQLEVTSGEQRSNAHAFYLARGYGEKRVRFVKTPAT